MTRKCHYHIPQINLVHREEEAQNTDSHMATWTLWSKVASSLFLSKMIAKLEKTQSTKPKNKDPPSTPQKIPTYYGSNEN